MKIAYFFGIRVVSILFNKSSQVSNEMNKNKNVMRPQNYLNSKIYSLIKKVPLLITTLSTSISFSSFYFAILPLFSLSFQIFSCTVLKCSDTVGGWRLTVAPLKLKLIKLIKIIKMKVEDVAIKRRTLFYDLSVDFLVSNYFCLVQ